MYALSANDGRIVWKQTLSKYYQGPEDGPLAATKSAIIGQYLRRVRPAPPWGEIPWMGTRASHHIFTLDKQTGRILWDRAVAIGKTPQWNSAAIPLIYRNRIYEGSPLAPVVTCLDAASGRILWQRKTDAVVKGGMVALDGVVYFGDMGGYLWAVNASDGRTIGRLRENLQFRVGSPIIVNRSLIVGSREGTVVALPLRDIRDAQAPLPP